MEQDFRADFQVKVTWFFGYFSNLLHSIALILVSFVRYFQPVQVRAQIRAPGLKVMTSQGVERVWVPMGAYGRTGRQ